MRARDPLLMAASPSANWRPVIPSRIASPGFAGEMGTSAPLAGGGGRGTAIPTGLPTMVTIGSWPSNRRLAARLTSSSVTASISALRLST